MTESHTQKGHFLSEEQKKIKGDMTITLLNCYHGFLVSVQDKFDDRSMMDLIMSVLIMFNRDLLVHIVNSSNVEYAHQRESFVRHFTKELYNAIIERLNKQAKGKGH